MNGIWSRFRPREKLLISLAGFALLIALIVQFMLIPLHKGRDAARGRLAAAEGTLSRLDRLEATGTRFEPPTAKISSDPVQAAIGMAQELGLSANSPPAELDGGLQFRFDGAEAPVVFTWLERVETRTSLSLHSVEMRAAGEGRVWASAKFTGAP